MSHHRSRVITQLVSHLKKEMSTLLLTLKNDKDISKEPSNLSWKQVFLTVLMPGKLSKSPITGRRRRKLITTGKNPLKKIQRFCKLNVVRDEAIEFVMIFYHYQDIRMCLNTSVTNKTWISRWEPNFARSFCTHQNCSLNFLNNTKEI